MGLCTVQEMQDSPMYNGERTPEEAEKFLKCLLDDAIDNGGFYGKHIRRWNFVPSSIQQLDASQPWLGFEWETSHRSEKHRKEFITHIWDNVLGCSFDPEGSGYGTEVTLPPQELSVYEAGEDDFTKMIADTEHLTNRGLGREPYNGTHLNFSLPEFRSGISGNLSVSFCVEVLNNSLAMLDDDQRVALFSRSPIYGGAFAQETYIEMKVFRSTYSADQFRQYVRRAINIIKFCQKLLDVRGTFDEAYRETGRAYDTIARWRVIGRLWCSNFFEVVEHGAEPVFTTGANLGSPMDGDTVVLPQEDTEYWAGADYNFNVFADDDYYDDYDEDCNCGECRRHRGEADDEFD